MKLNALSTISLHGMVDFDQYCEKHIQPVLHQMIGRELLVRAAKDAGVTVTEKEFSDYYEKSLSMLGGTEKMSKFLAPLKLEMNQHRALSLHTYLARKYATEFLAPKALSSDQVRDYYDEKINEISGVESLTYSYVGVNFIGDEVDEAFLRDMKQDKTSVRSRADIKALVDRYKKRLGGKAAVAWVFDNTTDSRVGGIVYEKGRDVAPGSATYFRNVKKDGEVFYIILFVESFIPRQGSTFEEVKGSLGSRITGEGMNAAIVTKVEELRNKAVIKIVEP
ncbi:MAG: hypothetical protein P1S46_10405 [bacterium]|nr:hypothetical protein [bacterium]